MYNNHKNQFDCWVKTDQTDYRREQPGIDISLIRDGIKVYLYGWSKNWRMNAFRRMGRN